MRTTLLTILVSITLLSTKAQTHLPLTTPGYGYSQWQPFPYYAIGPYFPSPFSIRPDSTGHKWQLQHFASLSAGYIFANGGGISYLSPQFGMALIRPLTNNLAAFGAVSASPVIFSMSRLYTDPAMNPSHPYNLGINGRVEAGLIYTNDAHTFSISGSVGVERGSYPVYQPAKAPPSQYRK